MITELKKKKKRKIVKFSVIKGSRNDSISKIYEMAKSLKIKTAIKCILN